MAPRTILALTLLSLTAGCVQLPSFPDPEFVSRDVDPTSPAAQRVLRAEEEVRDAPYPTFADIPVMPADARPAAAWNRAAGEIKGVGATMNRYRAENPPELTDADAFARQQRGALGIDPNTLPPAPTPEESAAYARSQQQRAKPRD